MCRQILEQYVRAVHSRKSESMTSYIRAFPMTWWAVWACIMFSIGMGITKLFSSDNRYRSDNYEAARVIFGAVTDRPLAAWGAAFLFLGLATAFSMGRSLKWTRFLLRTSATVYIFFAILFIASALQSNAPFDAFWLYLFTAVIHLAAAETIKIIVRGGRA